jgi:hypothetical protein
MNLDDATSVASAGADHYEAEVAAEFALDGVRPNGASGTSVRSPSDTSGKVPHGRAHGDARYSGSSNAHLEPRDGATERPVVDAERITPRTIFGAGPECRLFVPFRGWVADHPRVHPVVRLGFPALQGWRARRGARGAIEEGSPCSPRPRRCPGSTWRPPGSWPCRGSCCSPPATSELPVWNCGTPAWRRTTTLRTPTCVSWWPRMLGTAHRAVPNPHHGSGG